jgi:drug/metabolite transporter (DMT)-like permease
MDPILVATLSGIIVAFLWGTNDWLTSRCAKLFRPAQINMVISFVGTAIAAGLFLVMNVPVPDTRQLVILLVADFLITFAYLILVRALKDGAVGIIAPLGNSYPFVTVLLSVIFLGNLFSAPQITAMMVIILGACVLAYEKNHQNIPLKELHKDTFLAVVAAVLWGVAFFILGFIVDELPWQSIYVYTQPIALGIAFFVLFATVRQRPLAAIKSASVNKTVLMTGVTATTGALALYIGSDYAGNIVIPSVIAACAPLVASGWGAAIDKERLGIFKRLGAVIVVIGIIILNSSH